MRPARLLLPALCTMLLGLPGCAVFSDEPHYRGIDVTPHDLSELTPGLSRQADVEAVLGPPTFTPQFKQNDWVYVSQVTKMRIGRTEGVKKQHVVVVSFNDGGVMQGVTQKDLKNAIRVTMDQKTTPVPGGKASLVQQLIGGVGSYSPLGTARDTSGGVGGGTASGGGSGSSGGLGGSGF